MKRYLYVIITIVIAITIAACSSDDTNTPIVNVAYEQASATNGGILYDAFYSTEGGFDQANSNLAKFKASADFFRCKQCHGWDLLGTAGSYNSRGPKATRPNVSALNLFQIAKTKSAQELFDAMKTATNRRDISYDLALYNPTTNSTEGDKMPNYSQFLTDAQIWDLVKFMKEGAFDVAQLYDASYTGTYPTGKATFSNVGRDGNAASGNAYYTQKCFICHGADGKTLELESMTLGKFLRSKANEAQHKIKHGALGSEMLGNFTISLSQMKDLYKAVADTTVFPN
ncbi:MAG: c-type cytochrome [Bacteroidota bacterium]